jgi:hypothetical protein
MKTSLDHWRGCAAWCRRESMISTACRPGGTRHEPASVQVQTRFGSVPDRWSRTPAFLRFSEWRGVFHVSCLTAVPLYIIASTARAVEICCCLASSRTTRIKDRSPKIMVTRLSQCPIYCFTILLPDSQLTTDSPKPTYLVPARRDSRMRNSAVRNQCVNHFLNSQWL